MKQIKVLQIIDNINIDSGVSTVVMNLYRNIDRRQIQFDFLVCNKNLERGKNFETEINKMGGNVFYCGTPLSVKSFFSSQQYIKHFFRFNADEYDIVHLHTPTISEFTLKYARKYGVKRTIIHSHSTMTSLNTIKKIINGILLRRIKKYATDYWYCSTEAANFLYGQGYAQQHHGKWIHNAIDPRTNSFDVEKRKKIRKVLGVEDCKVACHVSNFSPIKNLDFLVNVIKNVVAVDKTWRFVFVGKGPCKEFFQEKLIAANVISFCVFIGFTEDVNFYLNGMDIFLLPSIKEGLPVAAIEAQATGLPCFISDTVTREANLGGVTYLALNIENWSSALSGFVPWNNDIRKQLENKFIESDFNIKNEAQRVQKLYLNMCHSS